MSRRLPVQCSQVDTLTQLSVQFRLADIIYLSDLGILISSTFRWVDMMWGAGIVQWLERRTRDRKVPGSSPGKERRENFLLQGQLSVLTLISVSVPPPCYRSST